MHNINYDTKTKTFKDHKLKVVVTKNEVQGYVDQDQVYGVYIDDLKRLRVSTATAPCGEFDKSCARIKCMTMVCETVEEIIAASK